MKIIFSEDPWLQRQQPWLRLIGFLATVLLATYEQWSAQDLAWSFWLAGLLFGLVYLVVYHVAQGDRETLVPYLFFWLFFYLLFAGFLDFVFAWVAWEATGADMPPLFATLPAAIGHAARERWPFLVTSGITLLPDYILDARTVNFTDWGKPLIGKEFLRMVALVFLLVSLAMAQAGIFALYAVLLVYFLPWASLRQIGCAVYEQLSVIRHGGVGLLLLALILGIGGTGTLRNAAAQNPDVTIAADATRPGALIDGRLWGSNLTQLAAMTDFPWMFCVPPWWPADPYQFWNWGIHGMVDVDWGPFVLCFPVGHELRQPRPVFHTLRWLISRLQGFRSVERLNPVFQEVEGEQGETERRQKGAGIRGRSETGRKGDRETRGSAACKPASILGVSPSPCLLVSLSPGHPLSASVEVYAYRVLVEGWPIFVLWAEDGVAQVMGEVEPSVSH